MLPPAFTMRSSSFAASAAFALLHPQPEPGEDDLDAGLVHAAGELERPCAFWPPPVLAAPSAHAFISGGEQPSRSCRDRVDGRLERLGGLVELAGVDQRGRGGTWRAAWTSWASIIISSPSRFGFLAPPSVRDQAVEGRDGGRAPRRRSVSAWL